jgi:VanZ family protein
LAALEVARRFCIIAGYVGSLMIAVLSLVPLAARPHAGIGGEYEHGVAYALVGAAFGMGYPTTGGRLLAGGALMAGAAVLELLQNFVPGRSPEAMGFLASSAGAWLGLGLVFAAAAMLRTNVK